MEEAFPFLEQGANDTARFVNVVHTELDTLLENVFSSSSDNTKYEAGNPRQGTVVPLWDFQDPNRLFFNDGPSPIVEEIKKMSKLRKLEDLENKFAKNMDENSYAELVQLKSQLNRE